MTPRICPLRVLSPRIPGHEPSIPVRCRKRVGQGHRPGVTGVCDMVGRRAFPTVVQLSLPSFVPSHPPASPSPWLGREPAPPAKGRGRQRGGQTQLEINTILTAVFYIPERTERWSPSCGGESKGINGAARSSQPLPALLTPHPISLEAARGHFWGV